ncbi:2-phosphosulfolactate phosphatase [Actinotalea solisilvae]|uniref:2-phosphosulfolactate phosphatase n=1 Tax=Actinotalea solisilvae TaxID=2072922 RepID=UPI0018F1C041|nr:2-phosphosulfolactate phosphatase [Actinotalea solisilvae]
MDAHRQTPWDLRLEWGLTGAREVAGRADVAVVVDVLSFTTTLSVAADLGTRVVPCDVRGDAAALAARHGGVVASGREARDGRPSLSPASLRVAPPVETLVLPSPNGSAISAALALAGCVVVGACLRNASAVAEWVATQTPGVVAVVPAGERWPDGGLRPAVEDLWGAGAVVDALARAGYDPSPEADVARRSHGAVAGRVAAALGACASGRELDAAGFAADVAIAAEADASRAVPVLHDGVFAPA